MIFRFDFANLKKTKAKRIAEWMEVEVEFIQGKNLLAADKNGLSDPFCTVKLVGKSSKVFKTNVIPETLDPKWRESFKLVSDVLDTALVIQCWDHDRVGKDSLGRVILPAAMHRE